MNILDLFKYVNNNDITSFKGNYRNISKKYYDKDLYKAFPFIKRYDESFGDDIIVFIYAISKQCFLIADFLINEINESDEKNNILKELKKFVEKLTSMKIIHNKEFLNVMKYLYHNSLYNEDRLSYNENYGELYDYMSECDHDDPFNNLSARVYDHLEIYDPDFITKVMVFCGENNLDVTFDEDILQYNKLSRIPFKNVLDSFPYKYYIFDDAYMKYIKGSQLFNRDLSYNDFVEYIEKEGYDINEKLFLLKNNMQVRKSENSKSKGTNITPLLFYTLFYPNDDYSSEKVQYLLKNNAVLYIEEVPELSKIDEILLDKLHLLSNDDNYDEFVKLNKDILQESV